MLRIRAGSVHPVTAPPILDGAVLVDETGRIAAVGPHPGVPTPPHTHTLEFRDAALVPGLVNCHTHLELTHLAGQDTEPEFPRWIRRIRELKDATPPDAFRGAAERGLRDCWARGVTCVADTGSTGAAAAVIAGLGGPRTANPGGARPAPAEAPESLAELKLARQPLRPVASTRLRPAGSLPALH